MHNYVQYTREVKLLEWKASSMDSYIMCEMSSSDDIVTRLRIIPPYNPTEEEVFVLPIAFTLLPRADHRPIQRFPDALSMMVKLSGRET
jgi:hypothetical protein